MCSTTKDAQEDKVNLMQSILPKALIIETHRGCNFRCLHCNVPAIPNSNCGSMSQSTFEALTPMLSFVNEVGYDNFGEPTMNPLLTSFIQRQKKLNCASRARINSNMSLISENYARKLLDVGLNELQASIDAASASLFSKIRVGGNLFETLQRIEMVANLVDTMKLNNFTLSACFVACRQNIHELPVVTKLLASAGVTSLYVNGFEPYRLKDSVKALWRTENLRQITYEIFRKTKKWASTHNLKLYLPSLFPKASANCLLPQNTMTISFDGEVSPCFLLAMESAVVQLSGHLFIRPRVVFGNVINSSPFSIWENNSYVQFRESVVKPSGGDLITCNLCLQRQGLICVSLTGIPNIKYYEQNYERRYLDESTFKKKSTCWIQPSTCIKT